MQISYEALRDKIMGCWSGKNIGGVLGAPFEAKPRGTNNVTFYVQDINGNPPGNDDLDLQLVWLNAAEQYGAKVNAHILADYWQAYITPNWAEYGMSKRNLSAGILPPLSGYVSNHYKDSNGAWIRTEIWACLAAGHPERAVRLAYEDAIVDHADEGVYATVFVAALESAAFACSDKNELVDIALSYIPENCMVTDAVNVVRKAYADGKDWMEARAELFRAHPSSFGTAFAPKGSITEEFPLGKVGMDAPCSMGIIMIGWLYGEDDFGKSLCMAVNCGEDTDCTAATLGAILGIIHGNAALPEEWVKPINGVINTCCINLATSLPVPKTVPELTDRVFGCIPRVLEREKLVYEQGGVGVITTEDLYCPDEYEYRPYLHGHKKTKRISAKNLIRMSPFCVRHEFGTMSVIVDYQGEPYITQGETKKLKLTVWDANKHCNQGEWVDVRIYTDNGVVLPAGNFASIPLRNAYAVKTELEIAFTAEALTAPTVNLIFDFTIKGRCTNALVKATYYAGSHTETYYEG